MAEQKTAIFAGGCFWCLEHDMKKISGVIKAESGYSGGESKGPTYENYSTGDKPHLEVVRITYDTDKITYSGLVRAFWFMIDPFDEKGQFCDKGYSYRAAIFYSNNEEKEAAEASKAEVEKKLGKAPIMLTLSSTTFYPAEEDHQNYADKNPIRYNFYRGRCGRDARISEVWKQSK